MKQTTNTRHILPLTALAALAFAANPAQAAISVINEDFGVHPDTAGTLETIPHTVSFDAGAADKLIVTLNAETGGGTASITFDGDALTLVAGTTGARNKGIYYLDNPFTGGAADLTFDMTSFGVVNGIGFGIVSIAGSLDGVESGNTAGGLSVDLTTTIADSFVVTTYSSNAGTIPTVPAGHTQLYTSGNIGSADGAAAYLNGVAAGLQTITYGQGSPSSNQTSGAVFAPAPVPEPSSAALIGLGGLALILRRCK